MRYYLDIVLERPRGQGVLFLTALVLAVAALDYGLVYRRQAAAIHRTAADLELVRTQETRLRAELSRAPRLRKEAAALRRELQARLPRQADSPTPLENISARAAMVGLEVTRFQPGDAREGGHFTETPMEVELKGTFRDLLRLFELSAESRDLLSATGLKIDALPPEDGPTLLRIELDMAMPRVPPGKPDPSENAAVPGPDVHGPTQGLAEALVRIDTRPLSRDPFQPYRPPVPPEPTPVPEPDPTPNPPPEPVPAPPFHAVGIVWGNHTAAALVKDSEGDGHVVQPGARLGDQRYQVKTITPCAVVVETTRKDAVLRETSLTLPRCGTSGDTR